MPEIALAGENVVRIHIPRQKVDMDWDGDGQQDEVQANVDMQNWKTAGGYFSFGLDDVWAIKGGELSCGRHGAEFRFEISNTAYPADLTNLTVVVLSEDVSRLTLEQGETSAFTFDAISQVTWFDENPCE